MRSFGPGRVVAPLALLVVVVAIFLILRPSDAAETATPATSTSTTSSTTRTTRTTKRRARSYTVRANDTLSAIADRTGVSLTRLQSLNPDVDAGALREGQKLQLTG